MYLNSPNFLFLFFPVFMVVYYFGNTRVKLIVGIIGSILFYAWGNLNYILLMAGLTLLAYLVARGIDRWREYRISLVLLWAGICVNAGVLIGFKLWTDVNYPL